MCDNCSQEQAFCCNCDSISSNMSNLNIHTKSKHVTRNYSCNICDKCFPMYRYKSMHAIKHSKDPSHKNEPCSLCRKVSSTKSRFQDHINMMHEHETFLPQLDGNNTLLSNSNASVSLESIDISSSTISPVTPQPGNQRNPHHPSKKKVMASFLPNIMVENHRSIFP